MNECITALATCKGPITAKGLCRKCYKRQYRIANYAKLIAQERAAWYRNRDKNLISMRNHKYSPKGRWAYMKDDAKKRELICTISLNDYTKLIQNPCYYCERTLPSSRCTGLDRIDNSKGYEVENVLPCCGECNVIRCNKLTVEETKVVITALWNFRRGKYE